MKKKELKILLVVAGILLCIVLFFSLKYGRREVATVHDPSTSDYYIKIYQIGYYPSDEYQCLCILYGPNGEISQEQFNAISIESGNPRYYLSFVAV